MSSGAEIGEPSSTLVRCEPGGIHAVSVSIPVYGCVDNILLFVVMACAEIGGCDWGLTDAV